MKKGDRRLYYVFQATNEGFHTEGAWNYEDAKEKMKRMLKEERCKVSIVREEDL